MKALGEYFLMVVFTLLLNRVYVFVNFMFNFEQKSVSITSVKTTRNSTCLFINLFFYFFIFLPSYPVTLLSVKGLNIFSQCKIFTAIRMKHWLRALQ